jgi:PAS domain-containing protein
VGLDAQEIRLRRKDGDYIWVEIKGKPISQSDTEKKLLLISRDITGYKATDQKLRESEERYESLIRNMTSGVAIYRAINNGEDFIFTDINKGGENISQVKREDVIGKSILDLFPGVKQSGLFNVFQSVWKTGKSRYHPITLYKDDRISHWMENYVYKLSSGEIVVVYESKQRLKEISALLSATRYILEFNTFDKTAHHIFDACKELIGATGGYVALLSKDGKLNEVLFLDAGGLPCAVDPNLPMPIRGLRAEAYKSGKAVYHNDFMNSEWVNLMPKDHVILKNVMFAPLNIKGKTIGIMGLANKEIGFDDHDAEIASVFSELAAIALYNTRLLDVLKASQKEYQRANEQLKELNKTLEQKVKERTKELENQNKFLTNILDSLSHPFYVININDYSIEMANKAANFGELYAGKTCYFLSHRRDKPCIRDLPCPIEIVKNTKKPVTVEHIHYSKEGDQRVMEVHGYPLFDENGEVSQMIE